MKLKQCADILYFGGQKNLKCAAWNNYNQEEMETKCYKFELMWKLLQQFFPFSYEQTSRKHKI